MYYIACLSTLYTHLEFTIFMTTAFCICFPSSTLVLIKFPSRILSCFRKSCFVKKVAIWLMIFRPPVEEKSIKTTKLKLGLICNKQELFLLIYKDIIGNLNAVSPGSKSSICRLQQFSILIKGMTTTVWISICHMKLSALS